MRVGSPECALLRSQRPSPWGWRWRWVDGDGIRVVEWVVVLVLSSFGGARASFGARACASSGFVDNDGYIPLAFQDFSFGSHPLG